MEVANHTLCMGEAGEEADAGEDEGGRLQSTAMAPYESPNGPRNFPPVLTLSSDTSDSKYRASTRVDYRRGRRGPIGTRKDNRR